MNSKWKIRSKFLLPNERKKKSKTENGKMLGSMWSNTHTDGNNNKNMTQKITSAFRKGRNENEGENKNKVQTKRTKYTNNKMNEMKQTQHKTQHLKRSLGSETKN
jgi:hypothetical protein